ncbi:MAG: ABC transporter substrate-binding protein, partial [Deltaproteobacteria bacterium]|nr:ABC transporter substrate-binding protein [Deltaproteobacteria bacterium]
MYLKNALCLFAVASFLSSPVAAEPLKVGVPTALTGDAAAFGQDIKNALTLANEELGQGKYELIFEDERCTNKDAASIAHKLIDIDKVKYALGFPCNGTLLATAPLYEKAGVLVITSSATSGDVVDIGKQIFRLFPSDTGCSRALQAFAGARNKKIAIITEQNEYPVMMERSFIAFNKASANPLEVKTFEFMHGSSDLRTIATKIRVQGFDAVFLNANTDASFIDMVKQLGDQKLHADMYSAYLPGSKTVLDALGNKVDNYMFCNLPVSDQLVTSRGKEMMR